MLDHSLVNQRMSSSSVSSVVFAVVALPRLPAFRGFCLPVYAELGCNHDLVDPLRFETESMQGIADINIKIVT